MCHFSDATEVLAIALTSMYFVGSFSLLDSGISRNAYAPVLNIPEFFRVKLEFRNDIF